MRRSFKFTDKDIDLINGLKTRLNITTDVGVIRYVLQLAYSNGEKRTEQIITETKMALDKVFEKPLEVKKPTQEEINVYIKEWRDKMNLNIGVFCPVHKVAALARCGCLNNGKLVEYFTNEVYNKQ